MRSPRCDGFTLVELLAAVAIAGLLGTTLVALLARQGRFYEHNESIARARQSLRGAADLLATELRMTGPGDLIAATPGSVSVRYDLLRAVVCVSRPAEGTASIYVYDSVGDANLPPGFRGYAHSSPDGETRRVLDGVVPSVSVGAGRSDCTSRGAPDRPEDWRYRTLGGWGPSGVPEGGALLSRYGRLTYRIAPSGFDDGLALWRNRQELVSPFREGTTFTYVLAGGTVRPVVESGELDAVRGLRLTALSAASVPGDSGAGRRSDLSVWFQR